jgi:hypothetical protein
MVADTSHQMRRLDFIPQRVSQYEAAVTVLTSADGVIDVPLARHTETVAPKCSTDEIGERRIVGDEENRPARRTS